MGESMNTDKKASLLGNRAVCRPASGNDHLPLASLLLAAFSFFAVSFSAEAVAQSTDSSEGAELEEIVVTGSHISSNNFNSTSPMTVLDSELLNQIGETNIGQFLERLPSVTSTVNSSSGATNTPWNVGLNTVALRNLGTERTLVLVNGRRIVSGMAPAAGYGVDMNVIPAAIVERIEVLTGNQSATYGSDAIAGVINIITKTDFEGAALSGQIGQTSEGDGERADFALTLGQNFGDGNNAWFSVGYSERGKAMARDREWSAYSANTFDSDGDGVRDRFVFDGSSFIPETALFGGGLSLKGDGSVYDADFGGAGPETSDMFNFGDYYSLQTDSTRKFGSAGLKLNLSEKSTATMEMNYARVESDASIEPLPLDILNEIYRVSRGSSAQIDLATHPLWAGSSAGQQFIDAGLTTLDELTGARVRVAEFGPLATSNIRTTLRLAGSVDYELDNGMNLDINAVYGVTDQNQSNFGDINLERALEALNIEVDPLGGYRCTDEVARMQGCVPYNPFHTADSLAGQAGITGFSDAAKDYLQVQTGLQSTIEQYVVSAILTGDLQFNVGNQDNVAFASGIEYRKESGTETPDGLRQASMTRLLSLAPTAGEFDVVEVFGELRIPLADRLSMDVAARFGDYSTIGSAATWKVGLDAPLSDSLRLRGATSTAIRAPNIRDLFAGRLQSAGGGEDPCDGITAASTGNVADNCRSIAPIQDRITTTGAYTLDSFERGMRSFITGSPDVREETATSFSLGGVFTPVSLDALSLAADYYSIEIEDAITVSNATTALNRCHEVSTAEFDPTCSGNVFRDARTGDILELERIYNNEQTIRTSGVDLEARYLFDNVGAGDLGLSVTANFITEYEIVGQAGDVTDVKGEVPFPDFQLVVNLDYNIGDFNFFTQARYRDETVDNNANTRNTAELNAIDSVVYVDLRGSYQLNDSTSLYVGANNLFDETPPLLAFGFKSLTHSNSNANAFDYLGRQVFAGFNVEF